MKCMIKKGESNRMNSLNKLKAFAAGIKQPMKVAEQKRSEISSYIEKLEHERTSLEKSEGENLIGQIIDIDSKIDASKKMLQKAPSSRYPSDKSSELFNEYNKLYNEYLQEFKEEMEYDIQQIEKYSNEIKKLLDKAKKTQTSKYIELNNVVGVITPYVDTNVVCDFHSTLRRFDTTFSVDEASEKFREGIKLLEK
ncbi:MULTISPECIES: hypothetical protein [Bacillus cereus group]|uniref:Uncharacterized protein n=1 Tax=Bacillus thuringiensis serovar mexicanensis TaxID=180868 RepID=A0A242W787_BACTU|nr:MULTISPECIES: hypothetical protein [Bacillus cereus group]MEB9668974.1 hypothetical protein [Bacillus anthracis]OTW47931.1 hypothetical protein BK699_12140 [Bacillus thuringiensis serovar mexicanensis]OTW97976.1 hypothetical protein BK705_29600 [Bacillus thuringiensis serovar monterrey]